MVGKNFTFEETSPFQDIFDERMVACMQNRVEKRKSLFRDFEEAQQAVAHEMPREGTTGDAF